MSNAPVRRSGPPSKPFNLMTGRGPSTWRQRSIISRMLPVAGLADHAEVAVTIVAEQQAVGDAAERTLGRPGVNADMRRLRGEVDVDVRDEVVGRTDAERRSCGHRPGVG